MSRPPATYRFYDDLAHHYHLRFESWEASIARQAEIWGRMPSRPLWMVPMRVASSTILTLKLNFGAPEKGLFSLGVE